MKEYLVALTVEELQAVKAIKDLPKSVQTKINYSLKFAQSRQYDPTIPDSYYFDDEETKRED